MWILLGFYLNIGKYQLAHFYLSPLILPVYRVIYIQFIVICDCQYALTEYIFPQNRLQFKIVVYLFIYFIYLFIIF